MFETQVFKSLEINPSEKIFKINGEDFGKMCWDYDVSVCQRNGEIITTFYRNGPIKFTVRNAYCAKTGELIEHFQSGDNAKFFHSLYKKWHKVACIFGALFSFSFVVLIAVLILIK